MNYNWNWGIFFQTSPDGVHTYLETLLLGTGWTLATALSAWCLALAMGSLIGVIRTTPNPWLVRLGTAYVELFRNIPLLVQMFLWYARHDLPADDGLYRAAAGLPQHGAGAAHPDDHPVPGHLPPSGSGKSTLIKCVNGPE